jgi:hypothetical protein
VSASSRRILSRGAGAIDVNIVPKTSGLGSLTDTCTAMRLSIDMGMEKATMHNDHYLTTAERVRES